MFKNLKLKSYEKKQEHKKEYIKKKERDQIFQVAHRVEINGFFS